MCATVSFANTPRVFEENSMKILFIKSGNSNTRVIGITPPLGLMYIASYIKETRGDEVKIFDIRFYKDPLNKIQRIMKEFGPDCVAFAKLDFW